MAKRCNTEGCENRYYAKGWCKAHYRRFAVPECKEPGCERPVSGRGWCRMHYMRWRKHGDTNTVLGRRIESEDSGQRWCARCSEFKPLADFHSYIDSRYGKTRLRYMSYCKECKNVNRRENRALDPNVKASDRAFNLKRLYGPDAADWYEKTFAEQDGLCAICGTPPETGEYLHFDHDHACCPTGRSCGKCLCGLLCNTCNRAIGFFDDDPVMLDRAAAYLRRTRVLGAEAGTPPP